MALGCWQATIVDDAGNVQANASIEVRDEADASLAALKSDRDGNVGISNPTTADSEGFIRFFTNGGAYKITATLGGFSREWRYVPIGTAAENDVDDFRIRLTEDLTLVVHGTNGNDATGDLDNEFATPQGAYDWALANLDAAGFFVKIRVNDGLAGHVYVAEDRRRTTDEFSVDHCVLLINKNIPNAACVEFEAYIDDGGVNDYSNNPVKFDADGGQCVFIAAESGLYRFQGFDFINNTGSSDLFFAFNSCTISIANCNFGPTTGDYHIHLGTATVLKIFGDYSITGGANLAHMFIEQGANVDHEISDVYLFNTPDFSTGYLWMVTSDYAFINVTINGSATGPRYRFENGGAGSSGGEAMDDFLPGDEAGVSIHTLNGAACIESRYIKSLASGSNAEIMEGGEYGSLVQITNISTTAAALFFTDTGHAITKLAGDASIQASTTPTGGNSGFGWNGSTYRIYNNTGLARSYSVVSTQALK